MFTLLTVQNSVAIVHAPVGCASSGSTMNIFNRMGQVVRGESRIRNARWFSTNLTESDTIHGGEDKLRAAVLAAEERYHPEAIFIFTSCVSGIIGDPVAKIVGRLQDEVKTRLVLSQCGGLPQQRLADRVRRLVPRDLELRGRPAPRETRPNLVNVVSRSRSGACRRCER